MISMDPPHIHVRNEISAWEGEREGRDEGKGERRGREEGGVEGEGGGREEGGRREGGRRKRGGRGQGGKRRGKRRGGRGEGREGREGQREGEREEGGREQYTLYRTHVHTQITLVKWRASKHLISCLLLHASNMNSSSVPQVSTCTTTHMHA